MVSSTNNIAFTSPVNPPGCSPVLTRTQIWEMLQLKIRSAETFVPQAIQSTAVLATSTDPSSGNLVTVREVTFIENQRKVKEVVTAYADSRVEFQQPDGSHVSNIISEGADGGLYMTYVFEWRHPGVEGEELEKLRAKERTMSRIAVEGTLEAMRTLVREGKF